MYDAMRICEELAKIAIREIPLLEYAALLDMLDGDPLFTEKLEQCLHDAFLGSLP